MSILVPTVVEKDPRGQERYFDIYSRLLKDFIVFVTGPIDMAVANTFIAQLLFLQSEDPKRTISISNVWKLEDLSSGYFSQFSRFNG